MTQGDPQETAGVREGQILAGKYRVEGVLGVGGMGVVVAAHHLQLDEKVAIKFLLPTMLRNREIVGRFSREARAAVKIKSEHVARVSDVGTLENGSPYMVMEFLEGGDLAAWLQRRGPLAPEQAVHFVLQACVGVASAHGMGIVHRDLKPANLFCVRGNDGQFVVKVLDFGISKISSTLGADSGGAMTHTAAVMGSPFYMSPEQMQSAKEVDARTDIWALGVVLYELLTGSTPFAGESFAEIAIKVATASFPPLRAFRPDVHPDLEGVVLKCLEKDKARRYANVGELALALAAFGSKRSRPFVERVVDIIQASGLSTSALALPPSPVVALAPAPPIEGTLGTMAPSARTASRGARRPKAVPIVTVAGTISVGVVIGLLAWAKHPPRAPTDSPMAGPSSPQASPPPIAAAAAVAAPSAPVVPSVSPTAKPVVETAPAPARPTPTPAPRPQKASSNPATLPSSPPAATPVTKANCNPNFTWGPNGNKIFKPECF
jgi:serine/threonine protein kinase